MAEPFSIFIHTAEVQTEFRRIDRDTKRAVQWTVRAGGRLVKQVAKRATPRYSGPKRDTYDFGPQPLVPGELRRSIHSAKRLKTYGPDGASVTVGPRTNRTHFYSQKIEDETDFMERGRQAAEAALPALAEQAWTRVTRRR